MRRPLPLYENVSITAIAAEGNALCRVNDKVVFVPFAAPGDVADIQIVRQKHSYCEGKLVQLRCASPLRRRPRCPHFGICGGCAWQHIPYEEQLKAKQQQVVDQLTRLAKVPLPAVNTILGSDNEYEYRNKVEYAFSNKRWRTPAELSTAGPLSPPFDALGYHIAGAWDKVLPISCCHLMAPLHNDIRNALFSFAVAHGLSFADLRNNTGLLRGVVLRATTRGEWMVIMLFRLSDAHDEALATGLMQHLAATFPQITSLLYVDNHKCNDTFGDLPVHVFAGNDHIVEQMDGLQFIIGPKSFYQTNSRQAQRLYSVVRDFAQLSATDRVYDLYTGTGTIAAFVARHCQEVIGIEYVPAAVEDAKKNSANNGLTNTQFFAGDMKDILTADFLSHHGAPDVIITDPPRAGMHSAVVATLLSAAAKRIVYVSCNPATQARDIALLSTLYRVAAVQPVDMFPQTPHVENVVLLDRKA